MMRDARYAQKRHTSYLQAHTDAIILLLLCVPSNFMANRRVPKFS